jgi:cytoskeletal protein CcmA (bactofilin family)
MIRKKAFLFVIVLILLIPTLAWADDLYVADSTYVLEAGETVSDNLYVIAGDITIHGDILGDLYLLGSNILLSGVVGGDLYAMGGDVIVEGAIEGEVYVLGGDVALPGDFAKLLHAAGGKLDLSGSFADEVNCGGGVARLSGTFSKDVNAQAGTLQLLSGAVIEGDLNYNAKTFDRAEDVTITGSINEIPEADWEGGGPGWGIVVVFWIAGLIGYFIVGMALYGFFPNFTKGAVDRVFAQFAPNLGWGVLALLLTPFIILVLLITVVGIPLGILLGIAYGVGIFIGEIIVSAALGGLIFSLFKKTDAAYWLKLLVGLIVLFVVALIPILNVIVAILIWILGLGNLVLFIGESRKAGASA